VEANINIFYIDHNPVQAARWMVDKHVVKMILESAQLLSTAHRVLDGKLVDGIRVNLDTGKTRKVKAYVLPDSRDSVLYSATHVNHPSAVWCRQSVQNYTWLVDHMYALMAEYTHRYHKEHKVQGEISYMLQSPPFNLKQWEWTSMPSCMAEEYIISEDPIVNYRNYYKKGKQRMFSWKNRQPPEWIYD
jgi:hypothetical protein